MIECDAEKLLRDGIHVAETLRERAAIGGVDVRHIRVTDARSLLDGLARIAGDTGIRVSLVVIVGHSGSAGLRAASDRFASWTEVGRWLAPLAPVRAFLVACQAGRWPTCDELFVQIPSLREIYGSPALLNEAQVELPSMLLAALARSSARIDPDLHRVLQGVNLVATRGLFFRRTRADHEATRASGALWTALEDVVVRLVGR